MSGLRGPFLKNMLKRPFVVVVLNEDDEIVDWDFSRYEARASEMANRFKERYPYNRIIVYKLEEHEIYH